MAKVTQVTNDAEHAEMLDRIIKCSIEIAKPTISETKKAEYLKIYVDMVLKVERYQRMKRIKTYPGLRQVYTDLGWEFDEPDKPKPSFSDFL